MRNPAEDKVRLGVSACLFGDEVRFDGGHTRDPFLTDTLGQYVEQVSVCPEDEAGFGTPREPMRLVHAREQVRLLTVRTRRDLTEEPWSFSSAREAGLKEHDLDGCVLKKDSPSCVLMRVKVYSEKGSGTRASRGLFGEQLCSGLPSLPVEEEGRLHDPRPRKTGMNSSTGNWITPVPNVSRSSRPSPCVIPV